MASKRTYADACGVARGLEAVGERWALLVVRELLLGPKRFSDLREGLAHVGPDVLSQRLKDLEERGLVTKRTLPPPGKVQVYELTPGGKALGPILKQLGRWGAQYAAPPGEGVGMSRDAHLLSMVSLFDADLAAGFETALELRVSGGETFRAVVQGASLSLGRGTIEEPDAVVTADEGVLIGIARDRLGFDAALAAGDLVIDGDVDAVRRYLTLFPLPVAA